MSAEYTTLGHVTVDVLADGSRRPGGTALYGALQAARLGLRARIVTRGVPDEIEALLAPWRGALELLVEPAARTTTLLTSGAGPQRRQRVLAWAGPIEHRLRAGSAIVHLAPVAAELGACPVPPGALIGLTPQGLVRRWTEQRPTLADGPPSRESIELARRCDAIVLSEQERGACAELIDAALGAGAAIAVTAGPGGTTLLAGGAEPRRVAVDAIADPVDDLGAGDVYASAFFVALHEGRAPGEAAAFASAAASARMLGAGPGAIAGRVTIDARLAAARRQG
ncbi:MAG: PfkB family carbohydrate kinase [Solirubrobacteraceae bacterium]